MCECVSERLTVFLFNKEVVISPTHAECVAASRPYLNGAMIEPN